MKQIIKNIAGITSIVIFFGVIYAVLNKAQSEEYLTYPPGAMKQQMAPIFCGEANMVYGYATNLFKQKPLAWADVKQKGDPDSATMAWISFWYSQETETGSLFLTVVNNGETCLMGYGMEWDFDTDFLLDIVNESFNEGNESK